MMSYRTIIKLLFVFIVVLSLSRHGYTQSNCATSLKKAEKLYDEGKIEDIYETIKECLNLGFSKAQKIRSYELLILTALVEENNQDADKYMMKLLRMEPEYTVNKEIMPADYEKLFKSFQTSAIFSLGLTAGLNFSNVSVVEQFGIHDLNSKDGVYSRKLGYQVGAMFNKSIVSNLEACIELKLKQNSYSYLLSGVYDFSTTEYSENQTRIDIPISFTYMYEIKRIVPFIRLGICSGFIVGDQVTATRLYDDNSHPNITGSSINMKDYRTTFSLKAILGGGIRYKISRGFLMLDVRYNLALNKPTDASMRYNNNELNYKYYVVEDDFKLNSVVISLGYAYSFYKPKKKNQ